MSNGPSFTAFLVAQGQCSGLRMEQWKSLIPEESARYSAYFTAECHRGRPLWKLISALPPPLQFFILDQMMFGLPAWYAIRKKVIEERVRKSLQDNRIAQLVVIGAGFDTLALRLSREYPQVRFFELDQPQTQNVKLAALERNQQQIPANCHFIRCNLAQETLEDVLGRIGAFHDSQSTLYVIEGLTMYLDEQQNKAMFQSIRQLQKGSCEIIVGALNNARVQKSMAEKIMHAVLHHTGEKYRWHIQPQDAGTFFSNLGFTLNETFLYTELQRSYRSNPAAVKKLQKVKEENYYFMTTEPAAQMAG